LFAKALKEHQLSKDLFRSESKRREEEGGGVGEEVAQPDDGDGDGDGEDNGEGEGDVAGLPPQIPSFSFTDASLEPGDVSEALSTTTTTTTTTATPLPRIHTALASWNRWPSHTRPERAFSADIADAVIVRDFADTATTATTITPPPAQPHDHDAATAHHHRLPLQWHHHPRHHHNPHRPSLPHPGKFAGLRHTSKNIVSFAKFYGTLLTSPKSYRGANRRTSINVSSGTLVHPELEMVVLGAELDVHAHAHSHEHWRRLKEVERKFEDGIGEGMARKGGGEGRGKGEMGRLAGAGAGAGALLREEEQAGKGKGKGKGRAGGLKLDRGGVKAGIGAGAGGSTEFDKLAGAKASTPFVEKGGFDWGGGSGGSGKAKGGGKPGLKLDLRGFTLGGGGGGGASGASSGLARADSGFAKLEGAKVGTPFVEKGGFDFHFGRSDRRDDVDPMAADDEDEDQAP
jgi:hypothetical protein